MIDYRSISPEKLWYLIGLIATDGNLSSDGRHIDITSKGRGFLANIRRELKISNKISIKRNGKGMVCYHIQTGGVEFYSYLLSIGLMKCSMVVKDLFGLPRISFLA
ncbi:MAG: LAGLIDADG family homing endonuclease [Elusimicrobia bacterium]|nr:LAGLIDADG family homing endonuclease [Elusimicrobiota bacterium]